MLTSWWDKVAESKDYISSTGIISITNVGYGSPENVDMYSQKNLVKNAVPCYTNAYF